MAEARVLTNVHLGLPTPGSDVFIVNGDIDYYHYGCDGFDDRGWGCGYRTLQSLVSWALHRKQHPTASRVPSLPDIQKALVAMQDKPETFVGSKQWIGSFEVSICMDYFTNILCKIVHVSTGKDLKNILELLQEHFATKGSPIMMGGDCDNSSKGILGVCTDNPSLLVLDPHFYGSLEDKTVVQDQKYVTWRPLNSFMDKSFYNLCLPQS